MDNTYQVLGATIFVILLVLIYLVVIGIGIAGYILHSIGLMQVAKNRGIKHGWLAFIPFAGDYLLGQVSDAIEAQKGKDTRRRQVLLFGKIAIAALTVLLGVQYFNFVIQSTYYYDVQYGILWSMLLFALVTSAGSLLVEVFTALALFSIFDQIVPKGKLALYFVLALFVPLAKPILLFKFRKSLSAPCATQAPAEELVAQALVAEISAVEGCVEEGSAEQPDAE